MSAPVTRALREVLKQASQEVRSYGVLSEQTIERIALAAIPEDHTTINKNYLDRLRARLLTGWIDSYRHSGSSVKHLGVLDAYVRQLPDLTVKETFAIVPRQVTPEIATVYLNAKDIYDSPQALHDAMIEAAEETPTAIGRT